MRGTIASESGDNKVDTIVTGNNKVALVAAIVDSTGTQVTSFGGTIAGTPFHLVSAASTNPTVVKSSAGTLTGWYIYNNASSARKIMFHNTASTPTAGANVYFPLVIPAGSAANVNIPTSFPLGLAFTTTTNVSDTDATPVAANDLIISLFYL